MSRPHARPDDADTEPAKKDRTHWLYMAVIVAVGLGILVGLVDKDLGVSLKPLGTGFVALIKMMISPIIFCTIVLGIGSVLKAAQVGRVGGLALGYFLIMSTFALAIGLVVGNVVQPGSGIDVAPGEVPPTDEAAGTVDFLLSIIPTTLVSPLTGDSVLSTLFVALLVGFAIQGLGAPARRLSAASRCSNGWSSRCWP